MRMIAVVAIAYSLMGCALVPVPQALSPRDVNERAVELDGRPVIVKGFLNVGEGRHSITTYRNFIADFQDYLEDGGRDFSKFNIECLTLINFGNLDRKDNQNYIVVTGVVVANYNDGSVVDLGACGGAAALDLAPSPR